MTKLKTYYVTIQATYLVEVLGLDAEDAEREALDVFNLGTLESLEVTNTENDLTVWEVAYG